MNLFRKKGGATAAAKILSPYHGEAITALSTIEGAEGLMVRLAGVKDRAERMGLAALPARQLAEAQLEAARAGRDVLTYRRERERTAQARQADKAAAVERKRTADAELQLQSEAVADAAARRQALQQRATRLQREHVTERQQLLSQAAQAVAAADATYRKAEEAGQDEAAAKAMEAIIKCQAEHRSLADGTTVLPSAERARHAEAALADASRAEEELAAGIVKLQAERDACALELAKIAADEALVAYVEALNRVQMEVRNGTSPQAQRSLPRRWDEESFPVLNAQHVPFAGHLLGSSPFGMASAARLIERFSAGQADPDLSVFEVDPESLLPSMDAIKPAEPTFRLPKPWGELTQTQQHNLACDYADRFGCNIQEAKRTLSGDILGTQDPAARRVQISAGLA